MQRGLVVEQSHQGQLYRLLRMFVDVPRGVERARPQRRQPDPRRDEVAGPRSGRWRMALQRVHEDELQPQE